MEIILLGIEKVLQKWKCGSVTSSILLIWEIVCLPNRFQYCQQIKPNSCATASQKEVLRFSLCIEIYEASIWIDLTKHFHFIKCI